MSADALCDSQYSMRWAGGTVSVEASIIGTNVETIVRSPSVRASSMLGPGKPIASVETMRALVGARPLRNSNSSGPEQRQQRPLPKVPASCHSPEHALQPSPPREFWRDIAPIADVFKPDAKPEVHIANAAIEDSRWYVPFTETVSSRPLWISPSQN